MRDEELSFFKIGSLVFANSGRIARWAFVGGIVAVAVSSLQEPRYSVTASVIASNAKSGGDAALRDLANQFGAGDEGASVPVSITSPRFLLRLATSSVVLSRIASDSLVVPELGGGKRSVIDLLKIKAAREGEVGAEQRRRLAATTDIQRRLKAELRRESGEIVVSVSTPYPSLSLFVVNQLLAELNRFNLEIARSQAADERRFVEARMVEQGGKLRNVEGRMQELLETNKQFASSPKMLFEHDRLQRELSLEQGVLLRLSQINEDVRLKEVRDVAVITVLEPPMFPLKPESRGRVARGILGATMLAILVIILIVTRDQLERRAATGDSEAGRIVELWDRASTGLNPKRLLVRSAS